MLLSFSVTNFRSIRDEQTLSMTRSRRIAAHRTTPEADTPDTNTVAGIYGSNASGKSNLILAVRFMCDAIRDSHSRWSPEGGTPFDPFRLDTEHPTAPSRFEAEIQARDIRYQYGFELNGDRILREWMYAFPHGRRQTWFERDADDKTEWYFGKGLGGQNKVISEITRPNSLFLSAAATANHDKLSYVHHLFVAHFRFANERNFRSRIRFTIKEIEKRPETLEELTRLLKFADLGICGIKLKKPDYDLKPRPEFVELTKRLIAESGDLPSPTDQEIDSLLKQTTEIELQHASAGGHELVGLPFESESMGTRSLLALGGPALQAFRTGYTLFVDEIDTSLHPNLVAELVRLFKSPETNPKHAQLVFTSHDTSLMGNLIEDGPVLERDQTWFMEKDQGGASTLYPLTDFNPRKQENLERGYLQGRYGAVPFIRTRELVPEARSPEEHA
ncbi:ATP-binding protein [Actinocrispum sp. NPDC049592]|uniref:AAA family ATPase n=1 Tax=Actinocrispum sp. NPDC049592 TaxID=3154835 RepID=UPI00343B298D